MDVVDARDRRHSLWKPVLLWFRNHEGHGGAVCVLPSARCWTRGLRQSLDGFAIRGFAGWYDEPAFQYLLDVERRRAEGARRPFCSC